MFRQLGENGQYLDVNKERGCWVVVDKLYKESNINNVISFSSFIGETMCPAESLNLIIFFSTNGKWRHKLWTDQRLKFRLACLCHKSS